MLMTDSSKASKVSLSELATQMACYEPQENSFHAALARLGTFFQVDSVSLTKIEAVAEHYTVVARWPDADCDAIDNNVIDELNPWRFHALLKGQTIRHINLGDAKVENSSAQDDVPVKLTSGLIRIPIFNSGKVEYCLGLDWSNKPVELDDEAHLQVLEPAARNIQCVLQSKHVNNILHKLSRSDRLTGLVNRPVILDHLSRSLARARRNDELVAVIYLNIDQFNTINDALGYVNGDHLLKAVAKRFTDMFRETDTIARIGGDSFVVVLENLTTQISVKHSLQRIASEFDAPIYIGGQNVHVRFSQGVAVYTSESGKMAEELLLNSEIAMKYAKDAGGNQIQFFHSEMNTETKRRLGLEHDLHSALGNKEFEVHFQQQLCLKTGIVTGSEALIRWRHPKLGMLPPSEFLWIAEETGLIIPLSEWILDEACRVIIDRRQKSAAPFQVAINVSPRWFAHPGFPHTVEKIVAQYEFPASCLEFEITEDVVLSNTETTGPLLAHLKYLGVKITLDDFGTGYSSLSYLRNIPANALKIDRSFVSNLGTRKTDAAIVLALITLCKELNIEIVAEGVENEEQLVFLQESGCHLAQGYHIARPEPYDVMCAVMDTVQGKAVC